MINCQLDFCCSSKWFWRPASPAIVVWHQMGIRQGCWQLPSSICAKTIWTSTETNCWHLFTSHKRFGDTYYSVLPESSSMIFCKNKLASLPWLFEYSMAAKSTSCCLKHFRNRLDLFTSKWLNDKWLVSHLGEGRLCCGSRIPFGRQVFQVPSWSLPALKMTLFPSICFPHVFAIWFWWLCITNLK